LAELSEELARLFPSEVRVLAVSSDPPEPLRKLKSELKLTFSPALDPERRLVNTCELGHCVSLVSGGPRALGGGLGKWQKICPRARCCRPPTVRSNC